MAAAPADVSPRKARGFTPALSVGNETALLLGEFSNLNVTQFCIKLLTDVFLLNKLGCQARSRISSLRKARLAPEWRINAAPLSLANLENKPIGNML